MTGEVTPDEATIRDDDRLLRRLTHHWVVSDGHGGRRLASGTFQDAEDDDGTRAMSVFNERRLLEMGLSAEHVIRGRPGCGLVAVSAGVARELGLTLAWAPAHEEGTLSDAHMNVSGAKTGSIRKKLVDASEVLVWPDE